MIQAKGINKNYGELQVLKDVDLEITAGEVVTLVGTSGAGKTTLLQILGSLGSPNSGSVTIDGVDLFSLPEKALSRFRNTQIGFVFQFHQLLPEFTALENVCIPAWIGGADKKETEKRALELFKFLNISHRITHKPSELSGGEQQRVAVARALINNPKVVFADEPSGNLDSVNKKELHELFFKLRDQYGYTFVIVTHDFDLAKMSDRTLEMKDGRIINYE
ncbi:MAG: ABC transporter ATP-binding protein [Bacteroidales bacterium]|nr:ABC transporter ATP-binding protein [Bacteroidales bacterium]